MSNQSKHTPGPWALDNAQDTIQILSNPSMGQKWSAVADVLHANSLGSRPVTEDEAEANARLIAAAPELFEACKALLSVLPHGNESLDIKARAAIAKAEGSR